MISSYFLYLPVITFSIYYCNYFQMLKRVVFTHNNYLQFFS